jgi:transposase-like protein
MSMRCTHHSPEFKARVVVGIRGRKTIQEIAAHHSIHPV